MRTIFLSRNCNQHDAATWLFTQENSGRELPEPGSHTSEVPGSAPEKLEAETQPEKVTTAALARADSATTLVLGAESPASKEGSVFLESPEREVPPVLKRPAAKGAAASEKDPAAKGRVGVQKRPAAKEAKSSAGKKLKMRPAAAEVEDSQDASAPTASKKPKSSADAAAEVEDPQDEPWTFPNAERLLRDTTGKWEAGWA